MPLHADPRPLIGVLLLAACIYDGDRRCGPTKVFDGEYCVCPAGQVAVAQDCVPATGLGDACDGTMACPAGPYNRCEGASGGAGYCTSTGCAATSDCPRGYACRKPAGASSFCARPPVGQGKTCQSEADCAGTEATYCESMQLKQCLVQGCDPAASTCFEGYSCCDLTKLGLAKTLCLPLPACP